MYILRAKHALCRANFKHVNTKIARIVGPVLSPFFCDKNVYKYKYKVLKYQQKYSYESSSFVSTNADNKAVKEVFPKKEFENSVELTFEGIPSKSYGHYHEHLTAYYGDYMTPLPPDKQKSKHGFYAEIEEDFAFDKL